MELEIEYLKRLVEEKTGVNMGVKTRKREVIFARRMYYKLMREFYKKMSLYSIGQTLPLKQNHATVLHQINEFEIDYAQDKLFRKKFDSIRNEFCGLAGEPEIDFEEENMRLKLEVSDLKKDIEKLKDDLKESISNKIQPRNQQTKVYYASEGISGSIY
jgi:hypothetical protein